MEAWLVGGVRERERIWGDGLGREGKGDSFSKENERERESSVCWEENPDKARIYASLQSLHNRYSRHILGDLTPANLLIGGVCWD